MEYLRPFLRSAAFWCACGALCSAPVRAAGPPASSAPSTSPSAPPVVPVLAAPILPLPHLGWRLRGVAQGQPPLAFTPDDSTLLAQAYDVARNDERLVLWDLGVGQVKRVWPHTGQAGPVAVSPDGKAVALAPGNGTRIELWDGRTGFPARVLSQDGGDALGLPPGASVESLAYGADARTLLVGYAAEGSTARALGLSGVLELDARTGREQRRVQFTGWTAQCLGVSTDGRFVAAGGMGPVVTVLGPGPGWVARAIRTGERRIVALGFDSAGRTLYVVALPDRLSAWDVETGAELGSPVELTAGRTARLDGSFSRDGRWLATEDLTLPDGVTEISVWDLAALPHATPVPGE